MYCTVYHWQAKKPEWGLKRKEGEDEEGVEGEEVAEEEEEEEEEEE